MDTDCCTEGNVTVINDTYNIARVMTVDRIQLDRIVPRGVGADIYRADSDSHYNRHCAELKIREVVGSLRVSEGAFSSSSIPHKKHILTETSHCDEKKGSNE
jgi:hypothetical protein